VERYVHILPPSSIADTNLTDLDACNSPTKVADDPGIIANAIDDKPEAAVNQIVPITLPLLAKQAEIC